MKYIGGKKYMKKKKCQQQLHNAFIEGVLVELFVNGMIFRRTNWRTLFFFPTKN